MNVVIQSRWTKWLSVFAITLMPAVLFAWIQFSGPYLGGVDPYYHVKVSQIYAEQGVIESFPWTQFSIHRDHFGDKEFLFHLAMIPFLSGDPMHGAKVYAVLLATVCMGVLLLNLHTHGVPRPSVWLLVCLGCGPFFLYRMAVVRPQIGGVMLALLSFYAVTRRRPWLLLGVSVLYPLTYCAPQVVLIIAVMHTVIVYLKEGSFPRRPIAIAAAGMCLGFLLHPHFPAILRVWYVQNVQVLVSAHQHH